MKTDLEYSKETQNENEVAESKIDVGLPEETKLGARPKSEPAFRSKPEAKEAKSSARQEGGSDGSGHQAEDRGHQLIGRGNIARDKE